MIAYLEPFIGIHNFKLGSRIDEYKLQFNFDIRESDGIAQGSYSLKDSDITLFVSNEKIIESIGCYSECLYKGKNLIGMSLDQFLFHTGEKYYGVPDCLDFEEDNIPQYVYEFDDIGLQVWTKEDEVVTVIVSNFLDEE